MNLKLRWRWILLWTSEPKERVITYFKHGGQGRIGWEPPWQLFLDFVAIRFGNIGHFYVFTRKIWTEFSWMIQVILTDLDIEILVRSWWTHRKTNQHRFYVAQRCPLNVSVNVQRQFWCTFKKTVVSRVHAENGCSIRRFFCCRLLRLRCASVAKLQRSRTVCRILVQSNTVWHFSR